MSDATGTTDIFGKKFTMIYGRLSQISTLYQKLNRYNIPCNLSYAYPIALHKHTYTYNW